MFMPRHSFLPDYSDDQLIDLIKEAITEAHIQYPPCPSIPTQISIDVAREIYQRLNNIGALTEYISVADTSKNQTPVTLISETIKNLHIIAHGMCASEEFQNTLVKFFINKDVQAVYLAAKNTTLDQLNQYKQEFNPSNEVGLGKEQADRFQLLFTTLQSFYGSNSWEMRANEIIESAAELIDHNQGLTSTCITCIQPQRCLNEAICHYTGSTITSKLQLHVTEESNMPSKVKVIGETMEQRTANFVRSFQINPLNKTQDKAASKAIKKIMHQLSKLQENRQEKS